MPSYIWHNIKSLSKKEETYKSSLKSNWELVYNFGRNTLITEQEHP